MGLSRDLRTMICVQYDAPGRERLTSELTTASRPAGWKEEQQAE
jgi:hypothetical protein